MASLHLLEIIHGIITLNGDHQRHNAKSEISHLNNPRANASAKLKHHPLPISVSLVLSFWCQPIAQTEDN